MKKRNNDRTETGRFARGNKIGRTFQPGQSGNPAGKPKSRIAFEKAFYDSLISLGSPTEAAQLLWDAAREHEPWAVTLLLARLAPEVPALRVAVDAADTLDFARLSDADLAALGEILMRIGSPAPAGLIEAHVPDDEE
jgi:hypothetical protein